MNILSVGGFRIYGQRISVLVQSFAFVVSRETWGMAGSSFFKFNAGVGSKVQKNGNVVL